MIRRRLAGAGGRSTRLVPEICSIDRRLIHYTSFGDISFCLLRGHTAIDSLPHWRNPTTVCGVAIQHRASEGVLLSLKRRIALSVLGYCGIPKHYVCVQLMPRYGYKEPAGPSIQAPTNRSFSVLSISETAYFNNRVACSIMQFFNMIIALSVASLGAAESVCGATCSTGNAQCGTCGKFTVLRSRTETPNIDSQMRPIPRSVEWGTRPIPVALISMTPPHARLAASMTPYHQIALA